MAKVFKLAPWPGTLVFTTDREEWMRLYAKRDGVGPERYTESAGLSWDDSGYHLVGVFDGKLSTLVHEMGHTAMDTLNHARTGDYTEGHNQEQFCYLLGHLYELTESIVRGNKP
ncbi:hypothetical protein D3C71_1757300 [compost metagenome]